MRKLVLGSLVLFPAAAWACPGAVHASFGEELLMTLMLALPAVLTLARMPRVIAAHRELRYLPLRLLWPLGSLVELVGDGLERYRATRDAVEAHWQQQAARTSDAGTAYVVGRADAFRRMRRLASAGAVLAAAAVAGVGLNVIWGRDNLGATLVLVGMVLATFVLIRRAIESIALASQVHLLNSGTIQRTLGGAVLGAVLGAFTGYTTTFLVGLFTLAVSFVVNGVWVAELLFYFGAAGAIAGAFIGVVVGPVSVLGLAKPSKS